MLALATRVPARARVPASLVFTAAPAPWDVGKDVELTADEGRADRASATPTAAPSSTTMPRIPQAGRAGLISRTERHLLPFSVRPAIFRSTQLPIRPLGRWACHRGCMFLAMSALASRPGRGEYVVKEDDAYGCACRSLWRPGHGRLGWSGAPDC